MHGVEKQELMHHFLGSAGRSAHPTPKTWCPATKEQGFAGSKAPRPPDGRPTDAGPSCRRQPNLVPEAEKSEPVARAWCRIPRRPEAPAGRHARLAGGPPTPRSPPGCNSKAGKSKTGAARGQSLLFLHLESCGSAGFFRCLYSCSYAGFLPFVKPYFTRV